MNIAQRDTRTALSLALVYMVRMLGLFMLLPVLPLYLDILPDSTPFLIGLAIGIYGLSQGLLQIPLGLLSDRFGRKPIIIGGLSLFFLGSIVAALADDNIMLIIVGRFLQGTGAIAAATLALAADLSSEKNRTKVMAVIGISIAISFVMAMILGPLLNDSFGLPGLFWSSALLALLAILIIIFLVPTPDHLYQHRDAGVIKENILPTIKNPQLMRLNIGVFLLHMLMTANFLVIPVLLLSELNIPSSEHWIIYAPIFIFAFLAALPLIFIAESKQKIRPLFIITIILLAIAQLMMGNYQLHTLYFTIGFFLFFISFNFLEAIQPSLIAKHARLYNKGTAMGLFTTSQFTGIFIGGLLGGAAYEFFGDQALLFGGALIPLIWLTLIWHLPAPQLLTTHSFPLHPEYLANPKHTEEQLMKLEGVRDAAIAYEQALAYLRVDPKLFSERALEIFKYEKAYANNSSNQINADTL